MARLRIAATVLWFLLACRGDPTSEAQAKAQAVGTWTGSLPVDGFPTMWFKFVLDVDGKVKSYASVASANDWGKGSTGRWHIIKGKFTDSGTEYFAARIQGDEDESDAESGMMLVVTPNGLTAYERGGTRPRLVLARGDHSPF